MLMAPRTLSIEYAVPTISLVAKNFRQPRSLCTSYSALGTLTSSSFPRFPRPVAVGRLQDRVGRETQIRHQGANFVEGQGGAQRILEHLPLVCVGVAGVGLHEMLYGGVVSRAEQIAHEEN